MPWLEENRWRDALRTCWTFVEEPNNLNPASHCDIAWAGALASHAHSETKATVGAAFMEGGRGRASTSLLHPRLVPGDWPVRRVPGSVTLGCTPFGKTCPDCAN